MNEAQEAITKARLKVLHDPLLHARAHLAIDVMLKADERFLTHSEVAAAEVAVVLALTMEPVDYVSVHEIAKLMRVTPDRVRELVR